MEAEARSSSVVCAKDATEVVREAMAWLRQHVEGRSERVASLRPELEALRARLRALGRRHPALRGVEVSKELGLLMREADRGGP